MKGDILSIPDSSIVEVNDTYNAPENEENQYVNSRSAAFDYIGRGWQITTDIAGATYDSGWTHEDYSATPEDCKRAGGVGIKTGPQSGNLVVIDPDMPIAVKAANRLLPAATLRSGHSGKWTHAFFYAPDLPEEFSKQFTDGGVIVEILAEKRRVAAPPSKHKSGNRRQWKQAEIVPTTMKAADVLRYARMIATTHWVAKSRPDGGLHAWELSVFGDLIKNRGLTADEAFDVIDVAHEESGWYAENERKKRTKLEEARNSSEKLDLDKLTTSFEDCDITELQRALRGVWKKTDQEIEDESWALCKDLATSEDILGKLYDALKNDGLVNEETNARLLTLSAISTRLLGQPVSMIGEGGSSTGKSEVIKRVVKTMPEEMYIERQSVTDMALAYMGEELKHRVMVIYELGGLGKEGSQGLEMAKQLLTEGRISRQSVNPTNKGAVGVNLEVPGPTSLWTTTTKLYFDHELSTRLFKFQSDDSRAQTRAIIDSYAIEDRDPVDFEPFRALYRWLERQDNRVSIPYLKDLMSKMPDTAVRLRRDAARLIHLVRAHALLHRASRKTDASGRVLATRADYAAVRKLVDNMMGVAAETDVTPTVRETVGACRKILGIDKEEPSESIKLKDRRITAKTLAAMLGMSERNASRRLSEALGAGYLMHDPDGPEKPKQYVLGEDLEPETTTLPEAEELVYSDPTIEESDNRTSKTLGASGESESVSDSMSDSVSDDTENVSDSVDSTPPTTKMMIDKGNGESTDTDDPGHGASSDFDVRTSDRSSSAHKTTSDILSDITSDMLIERVVTDIRFTHSTHTRMFDRVRHNLHDLRDLVNLVCGSEYSVKSLEAVMVEEDDGDYYIREEAA